MLMLKSSGHVGGDLVGFYPSGPGHLGLYAIDVSGHGITSALMTARLAGFLSGNTPEQNLALVQTARQHPTVWSVLAERLPDDPIVMMGMSRIYDDAGDSTYRCADGTRNNQPRSGAGCSTLRGGL